MTDTQRNAPHTHRWIDVTTKGDEVSKIICAVCGKELTKEVLD